MVLEHVAGDRLAAQWRLAATTGLRRGELAGLRWRVVDFDRARIAVVQQRARGAEPSPLAALAGYFVTAQAAAAYREAHGLFRLEAWGDGWPTANDRATAEGATKGVG